MKKVLLTTTALVMTAGVAAAEVSFSGTTQASVSNTQSAGNTVETHIDFNVAVSSTADNGLTMSAGFGYDAGRQVDTADFELDANEAAASDIANAVDNNPGWTTAAPSLTIGYNGFTATVDGSGVADLYNGDVDSGDLGISGAMAGLSFGLTTALTKGDDDSSMSLSYKMGDITASYVSTNNSDGRGTDASKMSASYTVGDAVISASSDDRDDTAEAVQSVGVAYTMDALKVSFTAATTGAAGSSIGDDWDVSVSYTAGAVTASLATDEDSVAKMSASYDLGGGANVFLVNRSGTDNGGVNGAARNRDFSAIGINFAF
jgi:outer membrane protein OmpU